MEMNELSFSSSQYILDHRKKRRKQKFTETRDN